MQIDLGAMRFPKIEVMDRVIGDQHWSLYNKVSLDLAPADQPG
tara:strand:+ start:806 stop:934 length:129 start_codon:yes stop_codon:yes gene_type:complete